MKYVVMSYDGSCFFYVMNDMVIGWGMVIDGWSFGDVVLVFWFLVGFFFFEMIDSYIEYVWYY